MKELSIEQKAKAYDEVMGRAKKELDACGSQDCDAARQIFRLFPELKEPKDERIRKEIIAHIKWCEDSGYCAKEEMTRWITFLEKQSEQKPVDIRTTGYWHVEDTEHKPAWSEEDEDIKETIIGELELVKKSVGEINYNGYDKLIDWLKSLRPQSQWKPSEVQMEVLLGKANAWTKGCPKQEILESLYNDLKKLKA